MKDRILTLLLFCFCGLNSAFAQASITSEGFLVLNNNDTLRGVLKERNPDKKISIRLSGKTEYKEYGVDEVRSIWYQDGYYYKPAQTTSDPKGEKLFLLCLVEGPMDLYKHKDIFFVKKGNDAPVKLEKKDVRVRDTMKIDTHYRRLLRYLMNDCPKVFKKISKTEFNDVQLVNVVEEYNRCIDPNRAIISRSNPVRIRMRKGVRAGVAFHHMVFKDDQGIGSNLDREVDLGQVVSFTGGIFLNFTYRDRLSFQPELLYTKKSGMYSGNLGGAYNRAYFIEQSLIQLPLSLYYTFPGQKLRPFLAAGGLVGLSVHDEAYQAFVGNVTAINLNNLEYGYRAGAGLRFDLNEKHSLYLEYLFESTGVRTDIVSENFDSKSHHVSLRFGF